MLAQGIAMVEVERVERLKVPYRDEEETGMPDFEFDFEKMQQSFLREMLSAKLNGPLKKKEERSTLVSNREEKIKKTERKP